MRDACGVMGTSVAACRPDLNTGVSTSLCAAATCAAAAAQECFDGSCSFGSYEWNVDSFQRACPFTACSLQQDFTVTTVQMDQLLGHVCEEKAADFGHTEVAYWPLALEFEGRIDDVICEPLPALAAGPELCCAHAQRVVALSRARTLPATPAAHHDGQLYGSVYSTYSSEGVGANAADSDLARGRGYVLNFDGSNVETPNVPGYVEVRRRPAAPARRLRAQLHTTRSPGLRVQVTASSAFDLNTYTINFWVKPRSIDRANGNPAGGGCRNCQALVAHGEDFDNDKAQYIVFQGPSNSWQNNGGRPVGAPHSPPAPEFHRRAPQPG